MWSDLRSEDVFSQVKEELNKEKVKLWLDPYYDENNGVQSDQEHALKLLSKKIAEKLTIDEDQCFSILRDLQNHALDRLKSNQVFKETGVASLRVRVSGDIPTTLSVNISLTLTTEALIQEVATAIDLPTNRIKLISGGKVLKFSETLAAQGMKNGMQLMAVLLAEDNEKLQQAEKRFKTLENTKKDIELIAGSSNANQEHYLQIDNQAGETINLPHYERKALVTAMTLHEKGRAALKKEDYSLALILFLEADKEYRECTSELLKSVDNYALLNLDIAWCYLCLRNPAQIPDADHRLGLCEQNFHRSYGANLERLMAIKGTTGSEAALFMRLHLLQGVVAFHQNKRSQSRALLERAQQELERLKINDESLALLLELGHSHSEVCIALRSTQGNIELAKEFIDRRCIERKNARERNRLKLQNERERISLGLCADMKQYCEPEFVNQLVSMGFDRQRSISAMRLANNVISEAINILQDQSHLLPTCSSIVSEELVAQVASLGVPSEVAREALFKMPQLGEEVRTLNNLSRVEGANEAVVAASASIEKQLKKFHNKRKIREEEEQQAFERLSEDLIGTDLSEDHLDLNLNQEEQFIAEYLSLLN